MDRRDLLIALAAHDRLGRAALCTLAAAPEAWQHLGTGPAAGAALAAAAAEIGVPQQQLGRALRLLPRAAELARAEERRAGRLGCRLVTRLDDDYPAALLDHALPPPVLYCRGELPGGPAVAIVGSRRMSDYGKRAARRFGRELAAAGVTVVSGFALGVDTAAHFAALEGGGRTVAVLGCGIDVDYPRGSADLAAAIAERGAVVSEFPLGVEPRAWHFPIRNRVIAALSVGTLVIQATFKSGSLITAHQALDLGRDVYAVPGRIFDEGSRGTNALIADGALIAREPRDVLESLSIGVQQQLFPPAAPEATAPRVPAPRVPAPRTPQRKPPGGLAGRVLEALDREVARTVEDVAARAASAVEEVLGALLELELGGWVRREPGPVYRCA